MLVGAAGLLALPGELDDGRRVRDEWKWPVDEHAAMGGNRGSDRHSVSSWGLR